MLTTRFAGGCNKRRVQPVWVRWPLDGVGGPKRISRLIAAEQQLAAHRKHRSSLARLVHRAPNAATKKLQLLW